VSDNSEKRPVSFIGQEDSILSPVSEFLKITDRNALFFITKSTGELIYISPLFRQLSGISDANPEITLKHMPELLQKTSETDTITTGEYIFRNQTIAHNTYRCSVFTISESYSCYTFYPVQAESIQVPGPNTEKKLRLALVCTRLKYTGPGKQKKFSG
jgi:hypothetical protein